MLHRSRRRRFVTALALAAGLIAAGRLVAGQAGAAGQQPPTFRVNVDYVEVDAVVTDASGAFVRDLARGDFRIFEDGKPQTITAFSLVDLPVERSARSLVAPAQPIEPDVRTNERAFDGRLYAMVIDDLHTNLGRTNRVKAAARQFVNEHLGANDLMAVIHTAGGGNQDFTSSKRLLVAAIDHTVGVKLQPASVAATATAALQQELQGGREPISGGGQPAGPDDEAERVSNAQRALGTLRDTAQWFASIHGRRKAILFVSEGLDYDVRNWAEPDSSPNAHLVLDFMRETMAAAGKGNVSIYGIDPRGMTSLAGETIGERGMTDAESLARDVLNSQESLRQISDLTGGFAAVNATEFGGVFDRIVRDNSGYYVLAYYPPNARPGAAHRIEVRVNRPGLTVRSRQGYVTPKAALADTRATGGRSDALMTSAVRDALNSPMPESGLVMSAFAAPFKGADSNASVLVGVEMRGRDIRADSGDRVTFSIVAVDAAGRIRGGHTEAVPLNLTPEQRTLVAAGGLRLLHRIDLPPGEYQLRLAAEDARGGHVGSLLYDLDVPNFTKGPLTMSGVVITSAATFQVVTVRPDTRLKGVLPAPPVTARAFPANDVLALFTEVYDNEASTPHKVDITTTVASTADGTVAFKTDEVRDASELQGRRGGYGYAARVPMQGIAPGQYVLTVAATSRLGSTARAERQVLLTVTAPGQKPGQKPGEK